MELTEVIKQLTSLLPAKRKIDFNCLSCSKVSDDFLLTFHPQIVGSKKLVGLIHIYLDIAEVVSTRRTPFLPVVQTDKWRYLKGQMAPFRFPIGESNGNSKAEM